MGTTSRSGFGLDAERRWRGPGPTGAVLAALAVLVYLNALQNPFVYDDLQTVEANASIRDLTNWTALWSFDMSRPITNASFAIDYAIWGPAPFGFRLTNVLLHATNVLLFVLLIWRLLADREARHPRPAWRLSPRVAAFTAAGVFAVHPLMSEAAGYISSRSELLASTLLLTAVLAGRGWMRHGGRWRWMATVITWCIGLATRETAVLLPVLLLAYDHLLLDDAPAARRRRFWRLHAPMLGVATAAGGVRLWVFLSVEHAGASMHWSPLVAQLDVLARYVKLLLVPSEQSIFHDVPDAETLLTGPLLTGGALATILVTAAWWLRRRAPLGSFGLVWFLVLLAPSSVLSALGHGEAMAEHRIYLASLGLFLAAGTAAGSIAASPLALPRRRQWLLRAALAAVLMSLGARTMLRNMVWSDPVALWSEAAALAPASARPRVVLGESLHAAGRHEDAIVAFTEAIARRPSDELVYLKLTTCLAELGRGTEAETSLAALQRLSPSSAIPATGRGVVALLAGRTDEARGYFHEALRLAPGDVIALRWLAVLEEYSAANYGKALRLCEEIRGLIPLDPANLECIQRNQGRLTGGSSDGR